MELYEQMQRNKLQSGRAPLAKDASDATLWPLLMLNHRCAIFTLVTFANNSAAIYTIESCQIHVRFLLNEIMVSLRNVLSYLMEPRHRMVINLYGVHLTCPEICCCSAIPFCKWQSDNRTSLTVYTAVVHTTAFLS